MLFNEGTKVNSFIYTDTYGKLTYKQLKKVKKQFYQFFPFIKEQSLFLEFRNNPYKKQP